MSDDNDNVSKLVILALGIVAIGFFAYIIFKESMKYQVGGRSQQMAMSLADDNSFQLERRIHQLEMAKNVRTLQPVQTLGQEQGRTGQFVSAEIDGPPIPRKVVPMNSRKTQVPNVPNIQGLSKGDQDRVRRMFFDML